MGEEAKISELYKYYWDYMIEKNIEGLRSLMSSDYCLYHMTGVKQSADEFLNGLKIALLIIFQQSMMTL